MHSIEDIEGSCLRPDLVASMGLMSRFFRTRSDRNFCVTMLPRRYFVRGLLCFAVHGKGDDYCWGLWAEIDRATYNDLDRRWEVAGREAGPVRTGSVANEVPVFGQPILGLRVAISLQPLGRAPHFRVLDEAHPVFHEQVEGISEARAMGFNHWVLGLGA